MRIRDWSSDVCSSDLGVGGTERHLSLVLPALWRAGWRVHVCALGDDGPMSAPLRQAGIPIEAISQRFWTGLPKLRVAEGLLLQTLAVRRAIARERPGLVHAFLSEPSIFATAATPMCGFRTVAAIKRNLMTRP